MQSCTFKCDKPPFVTRKKADYSRYYFCPTCVANFPKTLGINYCICCTNKARAKPRLKLRIKGEYSPSQKRYMKESSTRVTTEELKEWAIRAFGA